MAKIPRLHLPMLEPEDVVRHLGKQEQHWKEGRSTHALALSWFASKGFPKAVASALASRPDFASAELVDGFLERQVSLRTAGRNSQTDLLAIASVGEKLAIIPVEGKAGETSGDYVHQWLDASETKKTRLRSLCGTLGLSCDTAEGLRYQLLHWAASAVYEAQHYRTNLAVLPGPQLRGRPERLQRFFSVRGDTWSVWSGARNSCGAVSLRWHLSLCRLGPR
jgi:hypothetical protein